MTNVIDFLESLGRDARLRHATGDELNDALTGAQITPALRTALFGEDQRQIEILLGATTNVCCLIHTPEDDEAETEDDDAADDDDGANQEDEDDHEEGAAKSQSAVDSAAAI